MSQRNANESSILLTTIQPNLNYKTDSSIEQKQQQQHQPMPSSPQVDAFENEFALGRDSSGTNFFLFSERSSANRIDEWQAGWNVTNAIQVSLFF